MKCIEGENKEPELVTIKTFNESGSNVIHVLSLDKYLYFPLFHFDGGMKPSLESEFVQDRWKFKFKNE